MGGGEPKQFQGLGGQELVLWSVRFFAAQPSTRQIVVVGPEAHLDRTRRLCETLELHLPVNCVAGGARRQDSVKAGLLALSAECTLASVHDAARPFPPSNYSELIHRAHEDGAAIFAVPVTDTVKRAECGVIRASVPRDDLWAAQTPQVFRRELLLEALDKCDVEQFTVTDDAAAMEHAGYTVSIVEGSRNNIKVTLPEDFVIAEALAHGKDNVP